jgi:predicted RND superfamily exporter protein
MSGVRRRGSVIVLAVAILALLFIMGSALLMVSNQQRQAAEQAVKARELRAIDEALTQSVLIQLRNDAVGDNGVPYGGG